MNKRILIFLTLAACVVVTACKDEDNTLNSKAYKGPVQPADSYFNGTPVSEGMALFSTFIDSTKIRPQIGDPSDAEAAIDPVMFTRLEQIRHERANIIRKAIKDMVYVDGSAFMMGATAEQGPIVHLWEEEVHKVTLSPYYMSKFLVTRELYLTVMGGTDQTAVNFKLWNPDEKCPMDNRLMIEMESFCTYLNDITRLKFTLPTEAQWEFAARGGRKRSSAYKYAGGNDLNTVGCYWHNSLQMPAHKVDSLARFPMPIGSRVPNELGLYDMSGNLAEACLDWYAPYAPESLIDPKGASKPSFADRRVCRGGAWLTDEGACRVSARSSFAIGSRYNYLGFRIAHPFAP